MSEPRRGKYQGLVSPAPPSVEAYRRWAHQELTAFNDAVRLGRRLVASSAQPENPKPRQTQHAGMVEARSFSDEAMAPDDRLTTCCALDWSSRLRLKQWPCDDTYTYTHKERLSAMLRNAHCDRQQVFQVIPAVRKHKRIVFPCLCVRFRKVVLARSYVT